MKKRLNRKFVADLVYWIFIVGMMIILIYWAMNFFTTRRPAAIATDKYGYIYVGDEGSNHVRKFTTEGEQKAIFGGDKGWLDFSNYLNNIAVDGRGNVFIITKYSYVRKFDTENKLLVSWEAPANIEGIATDSSGNIYVKHAQSPAIQKLDGNGKLLKEWTLPAEVYTNARSTIYMDFQNNLYVNALDAKRLFKYDKEGNLQTTIKNIAEPYFYFTVDQNGYIYMADSDATIRKWDWNGNLVKTWGGKGEQPGQFNNRRGYVGFAGITVDTRGYIYTVHNYDDQSVIQQFDSDGRFLKSWTDGFTFGTTRLLQAFVFIFLILTVWIATKIRSSIAPTEPLQVVALPDYVTNAQTNLEMLQDNFIPSGVRIEEEVSFTHLSQNKADKKKKELNIAKAKKFIAQALGTFEQNNQVVVKRREATFTGDQIGNFVLQGLFSVLFPIGAYLGWGNPRLVVPMWAIMSMLIGGIVLFIFGIGITLRVIKLLKKQQPILSNKEYFELAGINLIIVLGYTVMCAIIQLIFQGDKPEERTSVFFIIMVLLALGAFVLALESFDKIWLNRKFKAGKYEEAIQRTRYIRAKISERGLYIQEAASYRLSGKYDAAEKVLYAALMQPRFYADESASKLLEALARLRLEQERFAESLYFAEKAHELNPKATSHILLAAEVYLRARVKLDRVWQLLAIVQAKTELTKEDKIQDNYTEALAQALVGEYKWAQELLKRALTKADKSYKPGIAAIYFRAGQIADMQGDNEGAIEYYRRAQFADPFGTTGTKASRILRFSPTPQPATLP
jgi:sugar lactone lactonase YvrE/tetratricopeptide (TPR) repeat protein